MRSGFTAVRGDINKKLWGNKAGFQIELIYFYYSLVIIIESYKIQYKTKLMHISMLEINTVYALKHRLENVESSKIKFGFGVTFLLKAEYQLTYWALNTRHTSTQNAERAEKTWLMTNLSET